MAAPTTAAPFKSRRSRLDLIRVAWPSETLAHNAKPAAIELSEDACGTARDISGIVPSIAAMAYAVTRRNPLIRRWTPGSTRSSHCPTLTSARRRCASRGKAGLAAGSVGGVAGCISGCSAIKCITAHQSLRDGQHKMIIPIGAPELRVPVGRTPLTGLIVLRDVCFQQHRRAAPALPLSRRHCSSDSDERNRKHATADDPRSHPLSLGRLRR